MNQKDAYIEQLENTIKDLQNQISNLTEMVILLRKEKYCSSSEQTQKSQLEGQLSLFNEAEVESDESIDEPITKEVHGYTRRDPKTKREELIKDLPVREVLCESASEDLYCPRCNEELNLNCKITFPFERES